MSILIIEDDQEWIEKIKKSLIFKLKDIEPEIEKLITVSSTYEQSMDYLYNKIWKLVIADINIDKDDPHNNTPGLTLVTKAATERIPIIIISGKLRVTEQGKLKNDRNISLYLKKDFVKYEFYTNENDFIDIVKEILFENNDFSIYKYKLSDDDKLYISHILVKLANDSQIAIIDYFINLVEQLKLPTELGKELSNVWIEDAGRNSTKFINWIQDKNVCKNYVKRFEITILGNLIKIMLEESGDKKLLSISQKHDVITDLETLNDLENIPEEIPSQNTFRYDVFICHSSKDKQFIIEKIIPEFKRQEITYWFDAEQINFGDLITQKIENGLYHSKYVMPCLSENFWQAWQSKSHWTEGEYGSILNDEFSENSKRIITPIKIDNCSDNNIPLLLKNKRRANYSNRQEFAEFLNFLKR